MINRAPTVGRIAVDPDMRFAETAPDSYWASLTSEEFVQKYLLPHARKAGSEGLFKSEYVMLEAARRILGAEHWPET